MSASLDPDDLDAQAAEFVIGTLDTDERAAFNCRLATDEAARGAVAAWERRLAPLRATGADMAPPAKVWSRIEQAIGASSAPRFRAIAGGAPSHAEMLRSRNRWRIATLSTAGLSAALAALLVARESLVLRQPDTATYVAAVNRGGDKPAMIVTVDLQTRKVVVRPVAASAPAGRSLELWYIGNGHSPRSMGLVTDATAHTTIPAGADADSAATFAVSVEPQGGSKTGGPTGAVLYSGQLVKD